MRLLKEIQHKLEINKTGRTISREAVRGIIIKGQKLLMIYSGQNGDYKFPGGGIKVGETHEGALIREIKEESGAEVVDIISPFGKVIEYDDPIEKEYDLFRMTSYYYLCKVGDVRSEQNLDQYEQELGYVPVWVEIDTAIRKNKCVVQNTQKDASRWTKREVEVLEQVKSRIISRKTQTL